MVTDCIIGMTSDAGFNCEVKPVGGLESDLLMINWLDIDRDQTLWNTNKTRITRLILKNGKRAFMMKGAKRFFGGFSRVKGNGFEHGLNLKFFHMDDNSIHQINQIVKSGLYVAVVEVKAKGINQQDAFEIIGYDYGLQAMDGQRDYNENDGIYSISFGTPSHLSEPRAFYKWQEKDYYNTQHRFNQKLEQSAGNSEGIFDRTFDRTFE